MEILFIGGTGEISLSCVRRCAELGHAVAVFNRGSSGLALPGGVRRIVGDVSDDAAYGALAKESFDAVCPMPSARPFSLPD
jgi:nucleoside-diphosphate-sugar epimerase